MNERASARPDHRRSRLHDNRHVIVVSNLVGQAAHRSAVSWVTRSAVGPARKRGLREPEIQREFLRQDEPTLSNSTRIEPSIMTSTRSGSRSGSAVCATPGPAMLWRTAQQEVARRAR